MQRLRSEFDADRQGRNLPKEFETATHHFEVPCGICGTHCYFDANGKLDLEFALTQANNNPFVCVECEADYEAAAHAH